MPPLPWKMLEEVWRPSAGPSTRLTFLREALCLNHINSMDEESEAERETNSFPKWQQTVKPSKI